MNGYKTALDTVDRQMAMCYAVGVEFGTYFASCMFCSSEASNRFYRQFKRLKAVEARRMQGSAGDLARSCLASEDTEDLACLVHVRRAGDGMVCLYFETGIEDFAVWVPRRGRSRLCARRIAVGE